MSSSIGEANAEVTDDGIVAIDAEVAATEQTFITTSKLARLLCDRYENSKALIEAGEPWTGAVADFIPFIDAYARDDNHEDLAKGLLARLMERSYGVNTAQGKSVEDFTFGVLQMLSELRHVPDALMRPRQQTYSKRQPSFFESMMATLKRYRFMAGLPQTFKGIADGIIVGGSMGYGPFFSVRDDGRGDSSDVDAIIVLEADFESDKSAQALLESKGVRNTDKISLLSRLGIYGALRQEGRADIISQRFDVPGESFNMSAHFMPPGFFERMNGQQLEIDLAVNADTVFVVKDFKPRRFEHPVCAQQSFDGSVYEYLVPEQEALPGGGVIAQIPGYIIRDGRLYPGLYQNLISPEFEVLADRSGLTTATVKQFEGLVNTHVSREKEAGHRASLGLSHIRSAMFAPGRYDQRGSSGAA